jgi:hypothetical protein
MANASTRDVPSPIDALPHIEEIPMPRVLVRTKAELEQQLTQAKTMMRAGDSILLETWDGQQFQVRVVASCVTGVMDLQLRRLGVN